MNLESLLHDIHDNDGESHIEAYKAVASALVRLQLLWKSMNPGGGATTTSDTHVSSSAVEDGRSNPLGPVIHVPVKSDVAIPIPSSSSSSSSLKVSTKEKVRGVRQTVINLADSIASYNRGLGGASSINGKQLVYLLTSFDVPMQLDTSKTLGKVFLGSFGVKLNTFYKRNIWFAFSLACIWLFGAITSFLSVVSVLPRYLSWTMTLTLPALFFTSLLMQYDIVVDLFQRFSTRYCFGNILIESLCLTWLFQGDIRSIIPIGGIFNLMFCLFFDALPPKLRAGAAATMIFFGIIWLLALQSCLVFNLYDVKPQQLSFGSIIITASSSFTSAISTLSLYLIKNLYNAVMNPHRYTVKTSRMILRRLEKSEADDIQAMDYILHHKLKEKRKKGGASPWLLKVMEIETHIQDGLIHVIGSFHSSVDGDGKDTNIDIVGSEVIEEYLQSKIKAIRELIKKERALQNEIIESSLSSPLSPIKRNPHHTSKGPSPYNTVRYRPSILSRADELESITSSSLGGIDELDSTSGIFLTYALIPSRIVDYDKEIGELFLGSYGLRVSEWWKTSSLIQAAFIVGGSLSILLSLLVCADLLPWWILLFLGLTLVPASFFIGLTLQPELCRLLVFRFDTILGYLFILQTTVGLSWTFSNFKMMAPIFAAPWFFLLLFCDAMGPKGRLKIAKVGIPFPVLWCIGIFLGIYFNWLPGVKSQSFRVLGLRFTSTSTACGGLIQFMILSLKNMYVTLHYENSLAVIHSPIETVKVNKRIATLIIAGRLASDRAILQRMQQL